MEGEIYEELMCTYCRGSLRVENSFLVCEQDNNHKFYIKNGIISFVGKHEFDQHWEMNRETSIPGAKIEVAKKFLEPLHGELVQNKKVLDIGCGDGVHAAVLSADKYIDLNIKYIGLDVSMTALSIAKYRSPNGLYLHADASHIPLINESIDIVLSYGVIAYTNDPKQTIKEFVRVLKPGGLIGIWVYVRPKGLKGIIFNTVRKISKFGGVWLTHRIADCIVPLLGALPVASKVNLSNATWQQCREVVLVNISPTKLSLPKKETVKSWIQESGLKIISEDEDPLITIWARK